MLAASDYKPGDVVEVMSDKWRLAVVIGINHDRYVVVEYVDRFSTYARGRYIAEYVRPSVHGKITLAMSRRTGESLRGR